jgi:Zn-dependent protease with chaperone function
MDFFSAQDAARNSTVRLIILFFLAVVSLVAVTNLLIMVFLGFFNADHTYLSLDHPTGLSGFFEHFDWGHFLAVGVAVTLVIVAGSLYKMSALSGGGKVVAESLGGRLVSQDTGDPLYRKVLNVVEEMAIASGTPVPPVYVLEQETGINAFAAGFTSSDAVIGVTRGCIEQLNREELQGVIAHEFSHVLNGDMRLNLRLVGMLHGILLIGLIGYYILRGGFYTSGRRSSSKGNGAGSIMLLGLGLAVIGYAGTFFGKLIKASVSRQREYLADASAVQFTRNPQGISGALKRIGGSSAGSRLVNPAAPELSHAYFSDGVGTWFNALFATHPPLEQRIRRIEPGWDGSFERAMAPQPQSVPEVVDSGSPSHADKIAAVGTAAVVAAAIDRIGRPNGVELSYAEHLIEALPAAVRWAAREPYGARAVIYALVLAADGLILQRQLALLEKQADIGVHDQAKLLLPELRKLDRKYRMTLVDMAMPALRQLSTNQYRVFKANLQALIHIDAKVTLFEWALQKIVLHNLETDFVAKPSRRTEDGTLSRYRHECSLVFSVLAYAQKSGDDVARVTFDAAYSALGMSGVRLVPRDQIDLQSLDAALDRLGHLKPQAKRTFIKACAMAILSDAQVSPKELELLRAISALLDCPMPPVINATSNLE